MCWVLHEVRLGFNAGIVGVCLPSKKAVLAPVHLSLLRAKLWLWDRHSWSNFCKGVVQKEGCMGKEGLSVLLYNTFPCWDLLLSWGHGKGGSAKVCARQICSWIIQIAPSAFPSFWEMWVRHVGAWQTPVRTALGELGALRGTLGFRSWIPGMARPSPQSPAPFPLTASLSQAGSSQNFSQLQ